MKNESKSKTLLTFHLALNWVCIISHLNELFEECVCVCVCRDVLNYKGESHKHTSRFFCQYKYLNILKIKVKQDKISANAVLKINAI